MGESVPERGVVTPYYDQDGITIYHARCEDVLPDIDAATVSLVLTDPPYGINWRGPRDGKTVEGDDKPFDPNHLLAFERVVLFGANHYADKLPPSAGWVVWDKTGGGKAQAAYQGAAELAWCSFGGAVSIFPYLWLGAFREGGHSEGHRHPTQKPVALMAWILNRWTEPGDLILDPYMGSGPVAQACQELGRRYIGIECVEEYCKVAVNRLAQRPLLVAS